MFDFKIRGFWLKSNIRQRSTPRSLIFCHRNLCRTLTWTKHWALCLLGLRSIGYFGIRHYSIPHSVWDHPLFVATTDWLRGVTAPSGKSVQLLNCMQIRNTNYNVVNLHFPVISLTSIDHHASLSAPFRVILVSTPPSIFQGTRNSFWLEKCCLDVKLSRFPWSLPELHPGGLFFDNRLKSYIQTNFELEYLDIQGEFRHAVKTDTSICICISGFWIRLPFQSSASHRWTLANLHKWTKTR